MIGICLQQAGAELLPASTWHELVHHALSHRCRKGFQKALVRLPHLVKKKTGNVHETKDEEFDALESQFNILEECFSTLHADSVRFRDAATGLFTEQRQLVLDFQEVIQMNEETACDVNAAQLRKYLDLLSDHKEECARRLACCIEKQLIQPGEKIVSLLKQVRAKLTKRDHKLIDFDRHRLELENLQKKKKAGKLTSLADEKKLIKQEQYFEESKSEYDRLNSLLKKELPLLFKGCSEYVAPCFDGILYFQEQFFTSNLKLAEMLCDEPQAKTKIEDFYNKKRSAYLAVMKNCALLSNQIRTFGDSTIADSDSETPAAPEVEEQGEKMQTLLKIASPVQEDYVVALYDFSGEQQGDLSFSQDDRIRVLERSESGWWTGSLKGQSGVFPSKKRFTNTGRQLCHCQHPGLKETEPKNNRKGNRNHHKPDQNKPAHCLPSVSLPAQILTFRFVPCVFIAFSISVAAAFAFCAESAT